MNQHSSTPARVDGALWKFTHRAARCPQMFPASEILQLAAEQWHPRLGEFDDVDHRAMRSRSAALPSAARMPATFDEKPAQRTCTGGNSEGPMKCALPGLTIHYETRGRGRPFLMLHGTPLDHTAAMADLEPSLRGRTGWRRIYPDMPGHGKTAGVPSIRNVDDYLRVLLQFVDRCLPHQRFVVGGSSFGAYLALGIAHTRPQQLDGLLLAVPATTLNPRRRRPKRVSVRLVQNDRILSQARREGMDWFEPMVVAETPQCLQYSRLLQKSVVDSDWLAKFPERDFSFSLESWRHEFPAPSLFLFGRQDHPYRYSYLWSLLNRFPRATFAVLDRAGHLLWGEQPGLTRALVSEWLDRVESWVPPT